MAEELYLSMLSALLFAFLDIRVMSLLNPNNKKANVTLTAFLWLSSSVYLFGLAFIWGIL